MRPNKFRDWLFWLVVVPLVGILCAVHAWGQVTIQPPPHKVVAGWPSQFRVDGLAADELGRVSIKVAPQSCYIELQSKRSGQWLWFEPVVNGRHVLSVVIDGAGYHELFTVEVGGDGPIPPPPPPPPPVTGEKIVIVIEESADRTQEMGAVLASETLRDYLKSNKHSLRIVDKDDQTADWLPTYLVILQARPNESPPRPEIKLPALIIADRPVDGGDESKVRFVGAFPATAEAVIEVVKEAGG